MSRINLDNQFFTDKRFDHLAKLLNLSIRETRMVCIELWQYCYAKINDKFTRSELITETGGIDIFDALIVSGLGEKIDNKCRLKGVRSRLDFLIKCREHGKKSAAIRAAKYGNAIPHNARNLRVEKLQKSDEITLNIMQSDSASYRRSTEGTFGGYSTEGLPKVPSAPNTPLPKVYRTSSLSSLVIKKSPVPIPIPFSDDRATSSTEYARAENFDALVNDVSKKISTPKVTQSKHKTKTNEVISQNDFEKYYAERAAVAMSATSQKSPEEIEHEESEAKFWASLADREGGQDFILN